MPTMNTETIQSNDPLMPVVKRETEDLINLGDLNAIKEVHEISREGISRLSQPLSNHTSEPISHNSKSPPGKPKKGKKESTYMDSDFWYYKGVVLNQKGRQWYESALSCYKQALLLDKDHIPSIFNMACNYEKLKCYPEAKEQFLRAIQAQERWPDAHYGLALVCIKLNQFEEAVKAAENAVKWSGRTPASHVLYMRALAYRENRQFDEA